MTAWLINSIGKNFNFILLKFLKNYFTVPNDSLNSKLFSGLFSTSSAKVNFINFY